MSLLNTTIKYKKHGNTYNKESVYNSQVIFKIKIMKLSEFESQLLELQNIKNKALKELNYEIAARTRDKIKDLLVLFTQITEGFSENELLEAERVLAKWR